MKVLPRILIQPSRLSNIFRLTSKARCCRFLSRATCISQADLGLPQILGGSPLLHALRVLQTTPCKLRRLTYCFELTAHLNFSRFHLTIDTLVLSVSHTDTTKTAWAEFTSAISIVYGAHKKSST